MAQLLEQFINGLVLGGIYALIAVGYTMVYGIIQLINFAHGEIFMFGAYLALMLITGFQYTVLDSSTRQYAPMRNVRNVDRPGSVPPPSGCSAFIGVDYSDRHIPCVTKPRSDDLVSEAPAISNRNASSIPRKRSKYTNRRDFKRHTAAWRWYSPLS